MATITLYAGKINQMPGLINEVKKSVVDYKSDYPHWERKLWTSTEVYAIWM